MVLQLVLMSDTHVPHRARAIPEQLWAAVDGCGSPSSTRPARRRGARRAGALREVTLVELT